jgi:hypothetical protein
MNSPSFRLGDFNLTVFSDGTYFLDGGAFFGIIPKVLWQKKVQADAMNRVATGLNSVLVRTGKQPKGNRSCVYSCRLERRSRLSFNGIASCP